MSSVATRADVAVVGGGPVGLATAIAACARGLDAVVLEARKPPVDKPCGEGIMPRGVDQLEAWGVRVDDLGEAFSAIRYSDADHDVVGRLRRPGRGVRRTELHERMRQRAEELGARLHWGERVERLEEHGGRFRVRTHRATYAPSWVVGADGLGSRVRRWAGLEGRPRRPRRFGLRRHLRLLAPPSAQETAVHVLWTAGLEAYLTPVGEGRLGVALLFSEPPRASRNETEPSRRRVTPPFDALLERIPELAEMCAGAPVCSRTRGAGPLERRARALIRGNLALVGDAAGYLDAITGEGLALGFQQAEALAEALASGSLGHYPAAVRRLRCSSDRLTRWTLLLSRSPALRSRVLATFARHPSLFERLLTLHTEASPERGASALPHSLATAWALARLALLLPYRSPRPAARSTSLP